MNRVKKLIAITVLTIVVSLGAPQAFAGPTEIPTVNATGPTEIPTESSTGPTEIPTLTGDVIFYFATNLTL